MPFTLSHPAIIIELGRKYNKTISLSGLIIGSMIPDIEYYLLMEIHSSIGHTLWGIFYFCLPLSLIILMLYHALMKDFIIVQTQNIAQGRFNKYYKKKWLEYFINNWYKVIFSIVLGVISHLLWDAFTHKNGYFVTMIDVLQSSIVLLNTTIPVYKILQHLSSFMGGLYLICVVLSMKKQTGGKILPTVKPLNNLIVILMMCLMLFLRYYWGTSVTIGNFIVSSIAALFYSILSVSIFYKIFQLFK